MSSTNETTQKILNFFFMNRIFAWRNNTSGIFDRRSNVYRASQKTGVADILAVLPPSGRLCAVEVKTGRDYLKPEQKGFKRNVESMGALAFVVNSFEDFEAQFLKLSSTSEGRT